MSSNSTCLTAHDNVFGPAVSGCRDNFDFTLLFEQTILSMTPSVLLLLIAPFRILQLVRSTVKTFPSPIDVAKPIIVLALFGIQVALLVSWTVHPAARASIPSATLSLVDAIVIFLLSSLEQKRSVQPSSLLSVYLVVSVLFDIATIRTLYLRSENHAILALSTTSIAVKIMLFFLENGSKRSYLRSPFKSWSREATSGIVVRTFFWWLNHLFAVGFRKKLSFNDLDSLDPDLLSASLENRMKRSWRKYSSFGRHGLLCALTWCLRWPTLMTFFPRLCLIGFNYAQPFLISTVVTYVGNPEANRNYGYGLIGATIFIYLGIAIFTAHYQHRTFRMITMVRWALVSLIYARTLELQSGVYDDGAAITLMSTDIDRIASSIKTLLDMWAQVIEIGIGVWLLERQLGWVCIAPIIVSIACTYGAVKVASLMGSAQRLWLAAIQKRVAMTSSMLASMKSVKMMGLTDRLAIVVQDQRVCELELSAKFRWLSICRLVISTTPGLLGPLFTFAIFAIQAAAQGSNRLSNAQAFTSLAIISLLTSPAQALLSSLPSVTTAITCFDRIQAFLLSQPWKDERTHIKTPITSSEESGTFIELRNLSPAPPGGPAVTVDQACIRPSKESPLALHDICFEAKRGTLTMITGPVGSGKTTLLKAILGELRCDSGTITVASKRMAYCRQTSWLPNKTIREIVCGISSQSEIDLDLYNIVIDACALEGDISQLPDGHDTLVGSRGVTLSGGQKQRLALARAAYARRDVVILDDVLSALDTTTMEFVLQRMFSKSGLFAQLGATVILATHAAVQHLELADSILTLNSTGHVVEQSTSRILKTRESPRISVTPEQRNPESIVKAKGPAEKQIALPKSLSGPSANDIADLNRRMGDVSVYKYYFKSIGWKIMLTLTATIVLNTLSASFPQIWLKWYTAGTVKGVGLFAGSYAAFVFTALLMTGASMVVMFLHAAPKSGAGLHKTLLGTVMRAPQSFFDKTDTGVTLNRFSQDMSLVDNFLPTGVIITLQALFNCLAMAAMISLGSSYMGLTTLALIAAIYFLQSLYLRTSRQIRFLDLEAKSPLYTNFFETLEGLSTIHAFGWEQRFKINNNEYLDSSQRPYYLMFCIQRWLNLVLQLIIGTMAVLVVGLAVGLRNTTNAGNLGISLTTILSFNTNIQYLLAWWTTLETSLGAIARTKDFAEQTPREDKPEENHVPSEDWPARGEVEFHGVSASYGNTQPALQNVVMHILPGQKIGICGRTGSGKTSLLSVLLRLLDVDNGTILIDGIDLRTVPRQIIRTRLVTVPQDPFLLNGTVRFNADPTNTHSDASIISALTKVQLWSILQTRGGLDADMTAQPLSQGQLQLFCLGCTLLRRTSKILILDEATSSMDLETGRQVQDFLRDEFARHTIITVAHRLETIVRSDRVAVLNEGKLVEFGEPRELLGRESAFRRLYSSET